MRGNRGIDMDPGRVNRELRELRRVIEALRSERRAAATTIGTGDLRLANGGSLVVDGGDVVMLDADGSEIFRIGEMEFGDRGLAISRANGQPALEIRKLFGPESGQAVAVQDVSGVRVVETEELFGGLRAPFFEHPFQPVAATSGTTVTCGPWGWERVTSSETFETLFAYDGKRQNPFLDLKVATVCSDATTAGEVRVVDLTTGVPLPQFLLGGSWVGVIEAGTTSFGVLDPLPGQAITADAGGSQAAIRLGIQARRTAGAGTITLAVPQSIGG